MTGALHHTYNKAKGQVSRANLTMTASVINDRGERRRGQWEGEGREGGGKATV